MINAILDETEVKSISFFDNESSLTQSDVLTCSAALTAHSPSRIDGVQQGICILMSRGAHYIAVMLAAWRAGFYLVPLNTPWPAQKTIDIFGCIQPAAVLVDEGADQTLFKVAA